MRAAVLGVILACAATAACTSTAGGLFGLGGAGTPTQDAAYMAAAAATDAYLIQASQVAASRAQRPEVRAFAERLVREHTQSAERLARAAAQARLAAPTPLLEPEQLQLLSALNAAAGAGFDQAFLSQQADLQARAHRLHRNYALVGATPDLRDYASVEDPIDYEHMMLAHHLG
jgi:putative membrane protein